MFQMKINNILFSFGFCARDEMGHLGESVYYHIDGVKSIGVW